MTRTNESRPKAMIIVDDGATKWLADAKDLLDYIDRHDLDTKRAHHIGGTETDVDRLDYDHMCSDPSVHIASIADEGSGLESKDYPLEGVAIGSLFLCCGKMNLARP